MKPPSGLTKSERKQYRKNMTNRYSDVDLSFNKDCSINNVSKLVIVDYYHSFK